MTTEAEVLLEHVKILATSEGRAIGTAGHKRARDYLSVVLSRTGLIPYSGSSYELKINNGAEEIVNIIAVAPGKNRDEQPVLVGAHYDTAGSLPGADDNAAGNAILLEIGKSLVSSPADCDVILAFFDNEESGFLSYASMGSIRFYHEQCTRAVRSAFIMDLVGHDVPIPGLESTMFVTGMESSSSWPALLRDTDQQNLRWATVLNSYVGSLSDHHIYAINNDPYLFFSCGRWAHYHQASDTFEKLNYTKMAHFKNALLELTRLAAKQIPALGKYDSTPDELYFLRNNVLPGLGMQPDSFVARADIDKFVTLMLTKFSI